MTTATQITTGEVSRTTDVHDGKTYTTAAVNLKVSGNIFTFCVVSGPRRTYVNVNKITNNPYRGLGKDYPTWEDADAAYKSVAMKFALMTAQELIEKA